MKFLYFQKSVVGEKAGSWQQRMNVCVQDIWLHKAEVCLCMGYYQPAKQLLAGTHSVAQVSAL